MTISLPQYAKVPMGLPDFLRNVTLTGGIAPARAYIEELLPDILNGTLEPRPRVRPHHRLDEVPDGYRAMAGRHALKVLIRPS